MDKSLQQRLVGAAVLVALGVIFIPALLDGSGYRSRHVRTVEIPPRPEVTRERVASQTLAESPVAVRKREIEKAKLVEQPPAVRSWALQVGTFSQQENALGYRDSLRKQGHKAYMEEVPGGESTSYRVRIGPETDRGRLERLLQELREGQSIDAFIVSHPS